MSQTTRLQPNWKQVQLYPLWIFLRVATEGSMTRAARQLDLSQPAISAHIRELEGRYGSLLVRQRSGVRLTPRGEILRTSITRVLDQLSLMEETLGDGQLQGRLLIGASSTPAAYLLPEQMAAFGKLHPQVELVLHVAPSWTCRQQLESHELDIAVTGELPRPASSRLQSWRWGEDRMQLYAKPDHPVFQTGAIQERFSRCRLLLREFGSSTRETSELLLRQHFDQFSAVQEVGGAEAIREFTLSGYGIALFSNLAVAREVSRGLLRTVDMVGIERRRSFELLWPLGSEARLVEVFCQFLREQAMNTRHQKESDKRLETARSEGF